MNHQHHRTILQNIAHRAMLERGLLPDFSTAALAELSRIQAPAMKKDAPDGTAPPIRDMRDILWASIDNDDSRDLDQLTVAEAMPADKVKILVAIADVDAVVKNGSAIDQHALHNTTSVYTAAEIFPMLPEKISTKDYGHSTAPNRRYPDLLTQRLLKAALEGESVPYKIDELDVLAAHCTAAEDAATKVERQVEKSAAALLLESRIGERFDAIVTGASEKGTWVRILKLPIEGKLVQGFEGIDIGDRLRVQLIDTNVEQGYIDFKKD